MQQWNIWGDKEEASFSQADFTISKAEGPWFPKDPQYKKIKTAEILGKLLSD